MRYGARKESGVILKSNVHPGNFLMGRAVALAERNVHRCVHQEPITILGAVMMDK